MLLTHLHLDHIHGLGFFAPLRTPGCEVHIWDPATTTLDLRTRLSRYLSPPLFPVHLRDLESDVFLHEVPCAPATIGESTVRAELICHPDSTVGYRIESEAGVLAYLTDHEPALGVRRFPGSADWTSGYAIAEHADVLIHDTQYDDAEYATRVGWGHSSLRHAIAFAELGGAGGLVTFHHDPSHSDAQRDRRLEEALVELRPAVTVSPGREGGTFTVSRVKLPADE